ncbi:MAG: aspartyl protease family protein [Prevotella sp.]|nr:aspartyl protease family protein [Prevotella sp.]
MKNEKNSAAPGAWKLRYGLMSRLLGFSFFISHFSFGPAGAQGLGRYKADFHVSATNFIETIAIEWQRGQVFVPVTIGGQTYRFLLDTGAGQSVVFSDSPLAQGPHVGNIISHDATGRTDTVSMTLLPPVTLGSLKLTGLRATVQPRTSSIDGILGFDLVNGGLVMTIDVPRRRLILSDQRWPLSKKEEQALGIVGMKYSLNFHVPYIDIIPFGEHSERVLFDTGSRQFFSMNKAHFDDAEAEKHGGDLTVEGRIVGRHAIGHYGTEPEGEVAFLQLDSLRLGRCAFSRLHCVTTQGGSHLGSRLLEYGSVTFDPRRRRLLFIPNAPTDRAIAVGNRQVEIAFVADDQGRPSVGLVWPQGEAFRLGFRPGDVVEQIDGRPVVSLSQFVLWPFMRGREYQFTVSSPEGLRRHIRWVRLPAVNR